MSNELREHIASLLRERGVHSVEKIMQDVGETGLHGALAVIRDWDAQGHDSTGLLVYMLRNSDLVSYKPQGDRTAAVELGKAAGGEVTPRLIRSVRAGCSTPDGIDRAEARAMYDTAARARGVPADKLIDMAMGEAWFETPPHPAKNPDNPNKAREYDRWVIGS